MRRIQLAVCFNLIFAAVSFAAPVTFTALLNGANEDPANASPATGSATVIFDTDAHTMRVMLDFADLVAPNTAAHIHCCTAVPGAGLANVATTTPTFTGFPTGATSRSYDATFDMTLASSFRAGFITANGGTPGSAEAALFAGARAGQAYFNLHSDVFRAGEIRGFLSEVPEPGTFAIGGAALAALAVLRRRAA